MIFFNDSIDRGCLIFAFQSACVGMPTVRLQCLNRARRHHTVINVDDWPHEVDVPSSTLRMKCSKCYGRRVDVRPNWKEASPLET